MARRWVRLVHKPYSCEPNQTKLTGGILVTGGAVTGSRQTVSGVVGERTGQRVSSGITFQDGAYRVA